MVKLSTSLRNVYNALSSDIEIEDWEKKEQYEKICGVWRGEYERAERMISVILGLMGERAVRA